MKVARIIVQMASISLLAHLYFLSPHTKFYTKHVTQISEWIHTFVMVLMPLYSAKPKHKATLPQAKADNERKVVVPDQNDC